MIVLDASLAVKLIIPEVGSDIADRWFVEERDDLGAPDLIAIETSQAIVRRVNARVITATEGRTALQQWSDILSGNAILTFRALPAQVARAADLALQLGHPVKDCIYLGLAMETDSDLITCDAKFAIKARTLYPGVRLLSGDGD